MIIILLYIFMYNYINTDVLLYIAFFYEAMYMTQFSIR